MFKVRNMPQDAVRLRLFPFSLGERAKSWLNSLSEGSITIWEQLEEKFLETYFHPARSAQLKAKISTFSQQAGESLYEAWERYKSYPRQCPHHGLLDWMIPKMFYNRLIDGNRNIVNEASNGKWMDKMAKEAVTLLEEIASQEYMGDEKIIAKAKGVLELDTINLLSAKVDALTKLVSKSQVNSIDNASVACELCGGSHSYTQCNMNSNANEDVSFVQGAFNQRGRLNSNTYNPQWRNHLGFSWSTHPLN